jgi:hypothetical protein
LAARHVRFYTDAQSEERVRFTGLPASRTVSGVVAIMESKEIIARAQARTVAGAFDLVSTMDSSKATAEDGASLIRSFMGIRQRSVRDAVIKFITILADIDRNTRYS